MDQLPTALHLPSTAPISPKTRTSKLIQKLTSLSSRRQRNLSLISDKKRPLMSRGSSSMDDTQCIPPTDHPSMHKSQQPHLRIGSRNTKVSLVDIDDKVAPNVASGASPVITAVATDPVNPQNGAFLPIARRPSTAIELGVIIGAATARSPGSPLGVEPNHANSTLKQNGRSIVHKPDPTPTIVVSGPTIPGSTGTVSDSKPADPATRSLPKMMKSIDTHSEVRSNASSSISSRMLTPENHSATTDDTPPSDLDSSPPQQKYSIPFGQSAIAADGASKSATTSPLPSPGRRAGAPSHLPSFPPSVFTTSPYSPSLRLSPSIIARHKPMPLLNLPIIPLPTPAPSAAAEARRNKARLKSLPALPLQGRDSPGDGDDDDDDEDYDNDDDDNSGEAFDPADDDEDRDEDASSSRVELSQRESSSSTTTISGLAATLTHSGLRPRADNPKGKQKESSFSSGNSTVRSSQYYTPRDETPLSSFANDSDYFTSRITVEPSSPGLPTPTPKPRTPHAQTTNFLLPSPALSTPRPMMHRKGSRSMANLLSSVTAPMLEDPPGRHVSADPDTSMSTGTIAEAPAKKASDPPPFEGPRRRRSLPTFNTNTDPPPYPASIPPFRHPHAFTARILPRDDEGREQLPKYSNDVYLRAIMPRKMEFTEPGIQAKDRKWRRVMCVLEGTAFKVYKCPASLAGVGVIGEWWEKAIGVGDSTDNTYVPSGRLRIAAEQRREVKWEADERNAARLREGTVAETPPAQDRLANSPHSVSKSRLNPVNLLKGHRGHRRSQSSDPGSTLSSRPSMTPRSSLSMSRSSFNQTRTSSSGQTSPRSSSTVDLAASRSSLSSRDQLRPSRPQHRHKTETESSSSAQRTMVELPEPDPADLIACYSLQHAESGLGNDYLKRKNVIRVRMDGEQFLLQAKDVASVVEWIEGIHAGTNVALDLDERPMPRGPLFPRRRRRPRAEGGGQAVVTVTAPG